MQKWFGEEDTEPKVMYGVCVDAPRLSRFKKSLFTEGMIYVIEKFEDNSPAVPACQAKPHKWGADMVYFPDVWGAMDSIYSKYIEPPEDK